MIFWPLSFRMSPALSAPVVLTNATSHCLGSIAGASLSSGTVWISPKIKQKEIFGSLVQSVGMRRNVGRNIEKMQPNSGNETTTQILIQPGQPANTAVYRAPFCVSASNTEVGSFAIASVSACLERCVYVSLTSSDLWPTRRFRISCETPAFARLELKV